MRRKEMISQCPQCKKELQFTSAQQEKIKEALDKLQSGQIIKMGCPHCKSPIELKRETASEKKDAFDLFPDLINNDPVEEETLQEQVSADDEIPSQQTEPTGMIHPPPKPPDISWLKTGDIGKKVQSPDDATVLILMSDGEGKTAVADAFKRLNYQIDYADSLGETMEKMVSASFAGIVLHTGFEGVSLAESRIHNYIKWLPMPKRRNIYYVLIGPDLQTLYDLEALTLSVNLVINEKDMGDINKILRKGIHDYGNLFQPFLESLQKG
jgi:hypothetical protein